jgi:single-strand DNA-binding protein
LWIFSESEFKNMASLNRVLIIGNLGQDPEIRHTQNQTAVCTLSIATTDVRMGQDGQRQEFTEWHRVVVWNKQAENCAKYLTKGRPVFVEGRLQTRSWEDKTGQKRYTTEIVASNVQFLGGAGGQARDMGAGQQQAGSWGGGYSDAGSQVPSQAHASGMAGIGGPETPGLDDIPF